MYVCMNVCMYVGMYVCMYVCVCMCVCMCIYTYIYIYRYLLVYLLLVYDSVSYYVFHQRIGFAATSLEKGLGLALYPSCFKLIWGLQQLLPARLHGDQNPSP